MLLFIGAKLFCRCPVYMTRVRTCNDVHSSQRGLGGPVRPGITYFRKTDGRSALIIRGVGTSSGTLRHRVPYMGDVRYHTPWTDFQSSITPQGKEWSCRNDSVRNVSLRVTQNASFDLSLYVVSIFFVVEENRAFKYINGCDIFLPPTVQ